MKWTGKRLTGAILQIIGETEIGPRVLVRVWRETQLTGFPDSIGLVALLLDMTSNGLPIADIAIALNHGPSDQNRGWAYLWRDLYRLRIEDESGHLAVRFSDPRGEPRLVSIDPRTMPEAARLVRALGAHL